MAEEKLLNDTKSYLASGLTPEQAREKLVAHGWALEDVNGALAVQSLSVLPIGRHPMSMWRTSNLIYAEQKPSWSRRIFLILMLMVFSIGVANWYGVELPYLPAYEVKNVVMKTFLLDAFRVSPEEPAFGSVITASTSTQQKPPVVNYRAVFHPDPASN